MKAQNTPNPVTNEETVVKTNSEVKGKAKPQKKFSPFWQSVLVGGVPGILFGIGGTAAATAAFGKDPIEEDGPAQSDAHVHSGSAAAQMEIHEAHSVNDDMSFNEAFAAARAEVGPGGAFVWHGQVYGTYRGDDPEWQAMSAEDRAAHGQAIVSQVHAEPYTPTDHEPEIVPVPGIQEENSHEVETGTHQESMDETGQETEDETGEVDVHIVGVEQVETEDGSSIQVGYGEVDGMEAVFADTDGDGEVDTVLIDLDGDGAVSDGEIFDAEGAGITMDALVAEAEANNAETLDDQLYAEMPDYTNDADMSSLV